MHKLNLFCGVDVYVLESGTMVRPHFEGCSLAWMNLLVYLHCHSVCIAIQARAYHYLQSLLT